MDTKRTELFDREALIRNRKRAQHSPVDFLRIAAIDDVQERLEEVNRSFTSVAIVTPRPDLWRDFQGNVSFVSDCDVLDLAENKFNLIVHDLCLHWANDPVGQIVQCRRALVPDGLFIATLFGGQTLNELRSCLAQAETEVTGGLSARIAPMAEIRDLGALLQRAGLALPVADGTPYDVTYPSLFDLMKELRQMGEGNCITQRRKNFSKRAIFLRAAQIYEQTFGDKDGRVKATFDIITLTGWAPDAGQQRPLRPGSAKNRLSDALGTVESKLKPF